MSIPVCKYCGKVYKKNNKILKDLPDFVKKHIEYIPDCDCFLKIQEKEFQEMERKMDIESSKNKIKKFIDMSLIDRKFLNSTFDKSTFNENHMKLALNFAKKFVEKGSSPKGILFFGGVGTGKTFASSCIANYLIENNKTIFIINMGLYISKLQREWSEAEKDVLNYIKNCDLLIIDDFGSEKISEFVITKTFALIDTRYRSGKPTIITSNLGIDEIEEKFQSRIADRIREMCFPIFVKGKSKRGLTTEKEFFDFIKL